jgi:YVTN family beta-propeller protein
MEKAQASTHDMQRPVVLAAASAFYQAVDFFDWESGAHIGTLTGLIAQPHELASDNDNRRLFLTHTYRSGAYGTGAEPGHEISIIDVDSQSVADVIDIHPFIAPHGVQYNKATGLLFASVEKSDAGNGVIIIDPQSRTVLEHIPTQAENSHWVAVTQAGDRCFVTHKEAPFLSVLDVQERRVVDTVALPGGAEEVDLSCDDRFAYTPTPHQTTPAPENHAQSRLVKIDTHTLEVVASAELPRANSAVRAGAHGNVYVTQMTPTRRKFGSERGALHVLDGATMTVRGTVPLGSESFTIREAPDGASVCVANGASGTVSVVDLATLTVTRTLNIPPSRDFPFSGTHGLSFVS